MIRRTKWVTGAEPGTLVSAVAQQSIEGRLAVVWRYAGRAARKAKKNVEYVHQLRVAERRAIAAIAIYADLLPKKKAKSICKTLHALRKAAGKARDLDVLAARLATAAEQNQRNDFREILDDIAESRTAAQKPLVRAYLKAKQKKFKRQSGKLLGKVRWRGSGPEPTFVEFACTTFKPMVDKFFADANADLSEVSALHQMRISGKQVRYAMELLSSAFGESIHRELYRVFTEVQERLGTINDHATAITLYSQWAERASDRAGQTALGDLVVNEKLMLDQAYHDFLDWWTAERAATLAEQFEVDQLFGGSIGIRGASEG